MSLATLADLDAILALERAAFARPWSEASWRDELEQTRPTGGCAPLAPPTHAVYVERDEVGRPIAVLALSMAGDVADLLRVSVAPDHRRRGLGRGLVVQAKAWAAQRGAARLLLEVSAQNAPAVALYEHEGFSTIDRRRDYYGPGDDALVMEVAL